MTRDGNAVRRMADEAKDEPDADRASATLGLGSMLAAQGNMARRSYMVGMVLTVLVLVGVVEFVLMLVLELDEHVPGPVAAAIDAVLLTVVVTPLLWMLVVRKLIRDLRSQSDRVALAARGWTREIESKRIDSQIVHGMEICDRESEVLQLVEASLVRLARVFVKVVR
ncbi:MAG: hypothetical protein Q8P61_03810 [Candidatus Nanopelagicales bacterium]|nr:hypothetical protein [Candidatus Nanopelagicales bacterium]